jgi:hypothetical protein
MTTPKIQPTCDNCKHHSRGTIHNYGWQECNKNWSDKQHGMFYGVMKHTCGNFQPKQQPKE